GGCMCCHLRGPRKACPCGRALGSGRSRGGPAVFHVPRHLLVGGEPHTRSRPHVLHELLQHRDPGAVADHVGVHGEDEEPSFVVGPVELRGPDLVAVAARPPPPPAPPTVPPPPSVSVHH